MKLLTKELCGNIPELYSQEAVGDPVLVAKFFTPDSNWTWYVIEGSVLVTVHDGDPVHEPLTEYEDGNEVLFFGLVDGFEAELGYFLFSELQSARGPLGLEIERDMSWWPIPLSEVEKQIAERSIA